MKLSKNQLRQKVISRIYENHNGNITGPVLQEILLDLIDSLKEDVEQGQEANFIISSLTIDKSQVNAGEGINVSATVQNTGGGQGSDVLKIELVWMPFITPLISASSLSGSENISALSASLSKSAIKDLSGTLIKPIRKVIWTKSINISNISAGGNYSATENVPTTDATPGQYVITASIADQSKSASLTIVSDKRYIVSGTVRASLIRTLQKTSLASSVSNLELAGSVSGMLGNIGNIGSVSLGDIAQYLGTPVSNVKVSLKGTEYLSTFTDTDGNYILETDKPIGDKSLVFTHVAYFTKEVPINNQSVVNASLVKKSIVTLPDDLRDKLDVLDNLKVVGKDILEADVNLKDNLIKTREYLDMVNSNVNLKAEELENGEINNTLVDSFKTTFDPVFEETRKIATEIATNGSTPELEKRKEANLDLINTGVTTLLGTIGQTSKDLSANSNAYAFINTELKTNLTSINDSKAVTIYSNIGSIAEGAANKANFSKVVGALVM